MKQIIQVIVIIVLLSIIIAVGLFLNWALGVHETQISFLHGFLFIPDKIAEVFGLEIIEHNCFENFGWSHGTALYTGLMVFLMFFIMAIIQIIGWK